MDTRWKSTVKALKEKVKAFLGFAKSYRREFLGGVALVLGLAVMVLLFREAPILNTGRTWIVGLAANVLIGLGLRTLLRFDLARRYGGWSPADVADYDGWKAAWRTRQRNMTVIAVVLFAAAVAFFFYQMKVRYYYYYSNYSMGYLLMATVLFQYGLCQSVTIRFMNGMLDRLMGAVNEVSQERLAAAVELERESIEKAARSERLKVDLISNVSHDLKTPLTSMVGYIELLKKEPLDPASRDYVDVISDKAQKLKEMIESLFSLAKASSGNVQLTMETVEMNMLIAQLFADMEDRVAGSGLNFVRQMTAADTRLVSDNMHLYRICQNLLENAIKYSAKGTRVFVKTWVEGSDGAAAAAAGTSRVAGTAGTAGNAGTTGNTGNAGTSGITGTAGSAGTAGITGTAGNAGTAGSVKTSGMAGSASDLGVIDPEDQICLEITNTAGYLMDFEKEDIVERFARGDKARSSDGNGLGLAIVSTYAGALGGDFDIQIDCDQFKVRLKFPRGVV